MLKEANSPNLKKKKKKIIKFGQVGQNIENITHEDCGNLMFN